MAFISVGVVLHQQTRVFAQSTVSDLALQASSRTLDISSHATSSRHFTISVSFLPQQSRHFARFSGLRRVHNANLSQSFSASNTNVLSIRMSSEVDSEAPELAAVEEVVQLAAVGDEESSEGTSASEDFPKKKGFPKKKKEAKELSDFTVGQALLGTIVGVQKYGAFVDIGAVTDGLVHISELTTGFVTEVGDIVKEGDQVNVTIKEIDASTGRISLTMLSEEDKAKRLEAREARNSSRDDGKERRKRGGANGRTRARSKQMKRPMEEFAIDQEVEGEVVGIMDFGAFVDIGAVTDGLVHISKISKERVNAVSDVLSVGQKVQVRITNIDAERNQISLTMRLEGEEASGHRDDEYSGGGGYSQTVENRSRKMAVGSNITRGGRRKWKQDAEDKPEDSSEDSTPIVVDPLPPGASSFEQALRVAASKAKIELEIESPPEVNGVAEEVAASSSTSLPAQEVEVVVAEDLAVVN